MKDQLISYETAIIAKEKGFDIPIMQSGQVYCTELKEIMTIVDSNAIRNWNDSKFTNICSAPTQSLLQKWLREEHDIHLMIEPIFSELTRSIREFNVSCYINGREIDIDYNFKFYEQALEAGLLKALKLIEK
jgi:hypothetical protein